MLADKLTRSRGRQSAGTRVEIPKTQKAIARRQPKQIGSRRIM
jgi:hypothetical protein